MQEDNKARKGGKPRRDYGAPRAKQSNSERPYRSAGPRKPYRSAADGESENRPARPYRTGRPYGEHSQSRSSRPYGEHSSENRERRPYGDRERRPYGEHSQSRSPRPYGEHSRSPRSFEDKPKREYRPRRKAEEAPAIEQQPKINDGSTRLNKFIANSGLCSRREADTYIAAGVISVNGEVITQMGFKIKEGDDVRFNGERVHGQQKVYIIMNKPKGYVTTVSDPHADKTVMDLISPELCPERVYPIGRLDKATTGVLLFTNDGEMAEQLTHPSYNRKKIYQAGLDKNLKRDDMEKMVEGLELEDGPAQVDVISYLDGDESAIGLEIHSGRNRIVRRMFENLGYTVKKLDRVYFAGLTKKNLKRGQWRFLTEQEVSSLKMGSYE